MEGQAILLLCILVPLLGAFLLPLLGRISVGLRNITALILVLLPFVLSVAATPAAMGDSPIQLHFDLPLGLSFGFYADGLAVFMALVASLVAAIIVFYSFGYMEEYDNQNEYYMMVVLFIGAMMGLIYSTNLIFIYTFWELTAICCWRLIAFLPDAGGYATRFQGFFNYRWRCSGDADWFCGDLYTNRYL